MMKIKGNNLQYAIIFFSLIFVLGILADKNLYRFKYYEEFQANYDFGDANGEDLQTEYAINFPFKTQMVDINGLMRSVAGQREMNGVTKLNNGYLTSISTNAMPDEYIENNAQAVIEYNNYCKERGITVLYAQPAYNISKWDSQLPAGVTDEHNETIDRLLEALEAGGVNTLDLRQCMYDDGLNQYDYYYRTDHHWTTEGGFYAYQKIATWISEQTGTYLDQALLDFDNYQVETYSRWHLGSNGQRTGSLFAGIDDYDLIYPKFETNILNEENHNMQSVKDTLVNQAVFQNRNAQNRFTYDWAYGNADVNQLSSIDAKTNLNVLLLSDSYAQAIKQYCLLTYKAFEVEWYSELSTAELQQYQPDVVIIMLYPGYLTNEKNKMCFVNDTELLER